MKFYFLTLLFVYVTVYAFCQSSEQEDTCKNVVYLEYSGNAPAISINYERTILNFSNSFTNFHIGFGCTSATFEEGDFFVPEFPLEISQILFKGKHHLELGFGITPFFSKASVFPKHGSDYNEPVSDSYELNVFIIPEIGYRFQKPVKGWMFKVGYTPIIYNSTEVYDKKFRYQTNFGISFGRIF